MSFSNRFSFFRRSDPVAYRLKKDSCLDHIDETHSYTGSGTGRQKQCYSVPSCEHNKRRATIVTTSSGSSLLETSKSGRSGSNKFLSFIHKGFHGYKSKSSSKIEKEKSQSRTPSSTSDAMQDIIPIPIRETAIQGHTRTLFHKVPNSSLRAKPLIVLSEDTKIVPIHTSLLSYKFTHCVKILSISPNVYRENSVNKYDLLLPTGTRSLGQSCRIMTDDEAKERSRSCHSSQSSLFSPEQVMKPTVGYVFSCESAFQQKKWTNLLTRIAKPNQQNERRKEISLNLWIQEAKNIPNKKRYFCEIYLDGSLYARTTTKMMGDMLFWGEEFNLCNLDEVNTVALLLWKCADENRSKKKKCQQQLICQIKILTKEIDQRTSVEKWYSITSNYNPSSPETPNSHLNQGILSSTSTACVPVSQSVQIPSLMNASSSGFNDQLPMLRVKARYQQLDVLPLSSYSDFIKFLNENAVKTLTEIEPYLKVKAKEDLAQNLIKIIHKQGTAVPILCDLIMNEINKSEDKNLILRGNTMASKAMEIYLKLIGDKYLQLTLSDFINRVLLEHDDCEVDPQKDKSDLYSESLPCVQTLPGVGKVSPQICLQQRQESLMMNVDMVWAKIMTSSIYFPRDLKTVFVTLRQRLHGSILWQSYSQNENQPDLCDRIISACIFLRFICPAILTPSLFGLIPEYPDNPKVTRTFTLVAKCIQTLANFTSLCGTKETYMVFMNNFIENNFKMMRDFLREISGNCLTENGRKDMKTEPPVLTNVDGREYLYLDNMSTNFAEDSIDLALCLATLHRQLEDSLQTMGPQNFSSNTKNLKNILEEINVKLKSEPGMSSYIPIKTSHSYQNIKLPPPPVQENPKRISVDTSYTGKKITYEDATEIRNTSGNVKPRHQKQKFIRPASNSHSAESTPTHQLFDKPQSTGEYLMTQSMVQESATEIVIPKKIQVDREWKVMLSASYAYKKSEEMFFAEPNSSKQDNKSSNSSGYQTLSRSTDSLGKTSENIINPPKSPSLLLKPSVKKCKQTRRQTEIISRHDPFNLKPPFNLNIYRPGSSEEIRGLVIPNCLSRYEDGLESCSTQTLTAANAFKCVNENVPQEHLKLSNSMSMPVFHSTFDIDTKSSLEFYSAFKASSNDGNSSQTSTKPSGPDLTPKYSYGRSAFHETHKNRQLNQTTKDNVGPLITMNDTEKIKSSLNSLRQNLNSRMKQLLLADRTTIQLELERVKLMKRICDNSEICGSISFDNLDILSNCEFQKRISGNGSVLLSDINNWKNLSLKKYLNLAENILGEAYNSHLRTDKGKNNILTKEMEDILVHIFQTNQNLQNTLMSKSNNAVNPDVVPKQQVEQNNFYSQKTQNIYRIHRSSSYKPIMENLKSTSLGSLITNPSVATLIEITDTV